MVYVVYLMVRLIVLSIYIELPSFEHSCFNPGTFSSENIYLLLVAKQSIS